jgi:hypothetical protein
MNLYYTEPRQFRLVLLKPRWLFRNQNSKPILGFADVEILLQFAVQGSFHRSTWVKRGPDTMDSILLILFASLICTMTALTFMEVRRIRKKLDHRNVERMVEPIRTKTAAGA